MHVYLNSQYTVVTEMRHFRSHCYVNNETLHLTKHHILQMFVLLLLLLLLYLHCSDTVG